MLDPNVSLLVKQQKLIEQNEKEKLAKSLDERAHTYGLGSSTEWNPKIIPKKHKCVSDLIIIFYYFLKDVSPFDKSMSLKVFHVPYNYCA